MPALCLNLVGATPALPLDSLSAIPAFLFDPRRYLDCGIPMITYSALDVSALDAKPDDADDSCTAL
ncbi:hypothetical protein HETIRDRAFT_451092 [Heterobasidion irregulare TC 32-1]|uniref:Uncharacterized protein n=1 Tax=Heterobasidion irregulare (strain TC 32-1) TaxID=747525 RepID=W4K7E2_HETIT|nr:uncharacterized protein HETIRDRAFT_451092 [Heterobasidion irregulare TC 32-1]ETW81250.1 hypothetical protein HETIRDRAFT_451092 [Heterobasidion irregulare TC 32-1]